jgi:hypothetical protein
MEQMRCLNAAFVTAALLTLSLVMPCSAKPTSNASVPGSFRATLTEAWTVYAIDVPELPEGEKYSRFTVISEDGSKLVAIPTVANRWVVRVPPWATGGTISVIVCGDGFCRPETYKWSTESPWFLDTTILLYITLVTWGTFLAIRIWRNK